MEFVITEYEAYVGGAGNSDPTLRSALHEDSLFTVMQENSLWPWQQQAHYCSHNRLCRKHNCTCAEVSSAVIHCGMINRASCAVLWRIYALCDSCGVVSCWRTGGLIKHHCCMKQCPLRCVDCIRVIQIVAVCALAGNAV